MTDSNHTSERNGGAEEDGDPRRTTIHLIYMMTTADFEFVCGRKECGGSRFRKKRVARYILKGDFS